MLASGSRFNNPIRIYPIGRCEGEGYIMLINCVIMGPCCVVAVTAVANQLGTMSFRARLSCAHAPTARRCAPTVDV
jgi:hypothetical protein